MWPVTLICCRAINLMASVFGYINRFSPTVSHFSLRNPTVMTLYLSRRYCARLAVYWSCASVKPSRLGCQQSHSISLQRLFPNRRTLLQCRLFECTKLSFYCTKADASKDLDRYVQEKKERAEKVRKSTGVGLLIIGSMMILGFLIIVIQFGSPSQDDNGNVIEDEYSSLSVWQQYLKRSWRDIKLMYTHVRDPSRELLLPDPLREPYYQPPYTLVIEMNGVLVHPEWSYETGWRFKKRPAVDYFIQQVGYPVFELVIYTAEQGFTAMPIIDSLDHHENKAVMYRLFRDSTKYMNGHHVKDLSRLNRDPRKVIYVDWNPLSFQLQPENALRVPKWEGRDEDTSLADLATLLRVIAFSGVDDVRPILQHYSSFDDPLGVFRENQLRAEAQHEQSQKSTGSSSSLAKSYAGRLFGFARH